MRSRTAGAVLVLLVFLAAPAAAEAVTVTNTDDDGPGSLRAALLAATAGETITVPKGHYNVDSGPLTTTALVKIVGAGARKTIIDANRHSQAMVFNAGAGTIRVSKLTIREGGAGGDGGAIESDSDLTLDGVAILNNIAGTLSNLGNGGGVYAANIVIRRSLFAYNHGYNGGAAAAGQITAINSTFAFNSGGSTRIGENGDGGAFDDPVILTDSTVAFNRCFNGSGCGGGVASSATISGTLITGNRAYLDNGQPVGSPGNQGVPNNCGTLSISQGHNLESGHDCGLAGPGDISGKLARLEKLKNNGGQTNTLKLGRLSPAFNAGRRVCTPRDQRGVRRPQGRRCDIGAFELHL